MAFESPQYKLARVLKEKRQTSGLSTTEVGKTTRNSEKSFRVSQSFLWEIEHKSRVPSPFKLLTLVRLYKTTLGEIYKAIGASDEEICECHKTLPANTQERQIVTDLLEVVRAGDKLAIETVRGAIAMAIQRGQKSD